MKQTDLLVTVSWRPSFAHFMCSVLTSFPSGCDLIKGFSHYFVFDQLHLVLPVFWKQILCVSDLASVSPLLLGIVNSQLSVFTMTADCLDVLVC